jgi:hypothetical protein
MDHPTIKKINYRLLIVIMFTLAGLIAGSCYYDSYQELYQSSTVNCDSIHVTYSKTIAPFIQSNCISCHSATSAGGGVNLSTYSNVKIYINNGHLWGAINHLAGYSSMPKNGAKLSDCILAQFHQWILAGALNN